MKIKNTWKYIRFTIETKGTRKSLGQNDPAFYSVRTNPQGNPPIYTQCIRCQTFTKVTIGIVKGSLLPKVGSEENPVGSPANMIDSS